MSGWYICERDMYLPCDHVAYVMCIPRLSWRGMVRRIVKKAKLVMMKLTENFSLQELLYSVRANLEGYTEQYSPGPEIEANLKELCTKILQPLRDSVGPVRISSGYRCKRLNKKIGGVSTSQHVTGQAADISVPGMSAADVAKKIQDLNLPFDQVINEFDSWVHVSYSKRNRRQVLKAVKIKGKTVFR